MLVSLDFFGMIIFFDVDQQLTELVSGWRLWNSLSWGFTSHWIILEVVNMATWLTFKFLYSKKKPAENQALDHNWEVEPPKPSKLTFVRRCDWKFEQLLTRTTTLGPQASSDFSWMRYSSLPFWPARRSWLNWRTFWPWTYARAPRWRNTGFVWTLGYPSILPNDYFNIS